MTDRKALRDEYETAATSAQRFCNELVAQLRTLFDRANLTLGVPVESRVKSWDSLDEKLQRKRMTLKTILALDDLVGIRAIFLFQRDVEAARDLIKRTFTIESEENAGTRLDEQQFGYQSWHYIVRMPQQWYTVPTLADLGEHKAELQIRTIAQHIWAAASHKLQYKQEENVPGTLRRSIHRVSALLETVDLELERVLAEREVYRAGIHEAPAEQPLDVDVMATVLNDSLPESNRSDVEPYADLLQDLGAFGIKTVGALRKIVEKHLRAVLEAEAEILQSGGRRNLRTKSAVYFNHVGLARQALRLEFGERWDDYIRAKNSKSMRSRLRKLAKAAKTAKDEEE